MDSYGQLKAITDMQYSELARTGRTTPDFHQEVVELLGRHGIRPRQDDGSRPIVTISHPRSLPGSIVVGLRYTKQNGTKTEDYFLFQPGRHIERCYGNRLEKLVPEYKGAHKLQR